MQLNATLSTVELRLLLQELIPLEIDLDESKGERLLILDHLAKVELVPEQGLRVEMSGKIVWPVLGVGVSVGINSLQLMVRIARQQRAHAHLVIELVVEKSDLAWVPGLVDKGIADRINSELRERNFEVAWDFEELLTHTFAMPQSIRCTENLGMLVKSSDFRIGDSAIEFDVKLGMRAVRRSC